MLNIINPGSKTLRISCPKKRKDGSSTCQADTTQCFVKVDSNNFQQRESVWAQGLAHDWARRAGGSSAACGVHCFTVAVYTPCKSVPVRTCRASAVWVRRLITFSRQLQHLSAMPLLPTRLEATLLHNASLARSVIPHGLVHCWCIADSI